MRPVLSTRTSNEQRPRFLAGVFFGQKHRMDACMPEASVKVQKSQISFYDRHLFAAASIPLRRKKNWPNTCLLVTFGLSHRVEDPRISVAVEPYPNRWTHHVLISESDQIDAQLMAWLEEARTFARSKR